MNDQPIQKTIFCTGSFSVGNKTSECESSRANHRAFQEFGNGTLGGNTFTVPQPPPLVNALQGGLPKLLQVAPHLNYSAEIAEIGVRSYQVVPKFDELIEPSNDEYAASGLKIRSVIRLAR